MPKPVRRRLVLPSTARAVSVEKHRAALRTAIHDFFVLRASAIATTAAALYGKALKSDDDKIKRILADLGLDDWSALSAAVQAALIAVFNDGGGAALKALKLDEPKLWDALNTEALAFAENRGAELVGMKWVNGELVENPRASWAITESTRDGLKDLLSLAFEEGMTPSELAEAIRDDYAFSQAHADLISRTELSNAHVQGELEAMRASGVVSGKSLLLSDGHDQDDECDDAEAEGVVDLDDDSIDPPLHPNCLVGGSIVTAGGVTAQLSRHYEGEVIRVLIEGADQFAVTPNHPILSRRGWIKASQIQKGDELIHCADPGLVVSLVHPDDHHVEARIEEIAGALLVSGGVATRSVPVSAEDLHGDALAGQEVDVVWAARALKGEGDSALIESRSEQRLALAHGRRIGFAPGGFLSESFRAPAFSADGVMRGNGPRRADLGPDAGGFEGASLAMTSHSEPVPPQRSPDCEAMTAKAFRKIDARLSGLVRAAEVLDVVAEEFAGHVYNLSTVPGWYFVGGIISSNCECTLIYEVEKEEEAAA